MDEKAARILEEQRFCVLATASNDGLPWATPLFYNFDAAYRLVWESSREAHHSQLIGLNPRVSIVVANFVSKEADEAVYFISRAREVAAEGVEEALSVFLHGAHARKQTMSRHPGLYLDNQPLRLYEAIPERAYLLTVSHDTEGRRIDSRREIDLG